MDNIITNIIEENDNDTKIVNDKYHRNEIHKRMFSMFEKTTLYKNIIDLIDKESSKGNFSVMYYLEKDEIALKNLCGLYFLNVCKIHVTISYSDKIVIQW